MCKIGVLAIGVDLYTSAYKHFQTVLYLSQRQLSYKNTAMDLIAHFVALVTLVQTFRGRVNRQTCGRVVFPVLAVKFVLELELLRHKHQKQDDSSAHIGLIDILTLVISVIFLTITANLAFGSDKSYVAHDEWLPKKKSCKQTQNHDYNV